MDWLQTTVKTFGSGSRKEMILKGRLSVPVQKIASGERVHTTLANRTSCESAPAAGRQIQDCFHYCNCDTVFLFL